MMTSSNANIFRVTGPLCGELSKQSWGRWFETQSCSLRRDRNVLSWGNKISGARLAEEQLEDDNIS